MLNKTLNTVINQQFLLAVDGVQNLLESTGNLIIINLSKVTVTNAIIETVVETEAIKEM